MDSIFIIFIKIGIHSSFSFIYRVSYSIRLAVFFGPQASLLSDEKDDTPYSGYQKAD